MVPQHFQHVSVLLVFATFITCSQASRFTSMAQRTLSTSQAGTIESRTKVGSKKKYQIFLVEWTVDNGFASTSSSKSRGLASLAEVQSESNSTFGFSHTEVYFCSTHLLDMYSPSSSDWLVSLSFFKYKRIPAETWKKWSTPCESLGYGQVTIQGETHPCTSSCCGVNSNLQKPWPNNLNGMETADVMTGVVKTSKTVYYYGQSDTNAQTALSGMCNRGSQWVGNAYNPLNHNCNTFSASVMKCALKLSKRQPFVFSSMGSVNCPAFYKEVGPMGDPKLVSYQHPSY